MSFKFPMGVATNAIISPPLRPLGRLLPRPPRVVWYFSRLPPSPPRCFLFARPRPFPRPSCPPPRCYKGWAALRARSLRPFSPSRGRDRALRPLCPRRAAISWAPAPAAWRGAEELGKAVGAVHEGEPSAKLQAPRGRSDELFKGQHKLLAADRLLGVGVFKPPFS